MKRFLVTILAVCLIISSLTVSAFAKVDPQSALNSANTENFDETKSATPVEYTELATYQEYLDEHKNASLGTQEFVVDASKLTSKTAGVKIRDNYNGRSGKSVFTTETDTVEFTFDAKEGIYNLWLEYYTDPGKNVSIERAVYINGVIPFSNADDVNFTRIWEDDVERDENGDLVFAKDIYGNEIAPDQKEINKWTSLYFYDHLGFEGEPLKFYFKNGKNTIKLESLKEDVTIGCIKLVPVKENATYEEYIADCKAKGYANYADEEIIIQGESPTYKSDQTLYPTVDVASASTTKTNKKQSAYLQSVNVIGGTNWQYSQQAITWTVPATAKAGMYSLNIKVRKNIYEGMISSRKLYINGEVPFAESMAIPFKYSADWELVSPQTDKGEKCLVYLQPGDTITLENTLGEIGPIQQKAEETLNNINEIYRSIIMITGSSPDTARDYQLDKLIPSVIEEMKTQSEVLTKIVDDIVAFTQDKGSAMSTLETLARQMLMFYENPEKIPKQLSTFKTNIGSLGTWINDANKTPLEIDYISLSSPDKEPAKAQFGAWTKFSYSFNRFISSFVVDYNAIGTLEKVTNKKDTITVWMTTGRDQYQQLRQLVNNNYTTQTGNQINLELVNAGALLSAVVAGIGPDVILDQPKAEPVNYALRNAIQSLSVFDDIDEVLKRFSYEAVVPFTFFNGETTDVYALPEQQSFHMLFYRKDVLAELGLGIPNTWDQLIQCITVLNKNNMEFGMPQSLNMYYTMLLQYGGSMFTPDNKATNLKTTEATKAFKLWTNFFVNYDCPKTYDFKNRFRTGEMPLGVDAFTLYNTLEVSAPEIRGLWGFTSVPGVIGEDGKINRSNDLSDSCSFILKDNKNLELSWEFLKWWTSAETQSAFGNRIESALGTSARYNSANIEAFQKLPWTAEQLTALNKQLETSKSLPEIAGSYFLNRHILNAFRKVVYKSKDARDTLYDYSNVIDSEITRKRQEFGLPVD